MNLGLPPSGANLCSEWSEHGQVPVDRGTAGAKLTCRSRRGSNYRPFLNRGFGVRTPVLRVSRRARLRVSKSCHPGITRRSVRSHENPTDSEFDVRSPFPAQHGWCHISPVRYAKLVQLDQSVKSSWMNCVGLITRRSEVQILPPPPTKAVLRIRAGSPTSPDDDRTEHAPVRLAGVERRPDPVVLEVAEPEADPLDALDQVVEGFGRTVGEPGQVEVGDLVEPGLESSSEPRKRRFRASKSGVSGPCALLSWPPALQ